MALQAIDNPSWTRSFLKISKNSNQEPYTCTPCIWCKYSSIHLRLQKPDIFSCLSERIWFYAQNCVDIFFSGQHSFLTTNQPILYCSVNSTTLLVESTSLFAISLDIAAKTPLALLGIQAFSFRFSVEISETLKSVRRSKIFISLHLLCRCFRDAWFPFLLFGLMPFARRLIFLASWVYIK